MVLNIHYGSEVEMHKDQKKLGAVAQAYNPSDSGSLGGLQFRGQPGKFSKILCQNKK